MGKESKKIEVGTLIVAAIAAAASIGSVVWGGTIAASISAQSNRVDAATSRQAVAYSAYFEELAKVNEFLYANLVWAGSGATDPTPANLDAFWISAEQMQQAVESDYINAALVTTDKKLNKYLDKMRFAQQDVWTGFKCKSAIQDSESCGNIQPASHEEIKLTLDAWAKDFGTTKSAFIAQARQDLSPNR